MRLNIKNGLKVVEDPNKKEFFFKNRRGTSPRVCNINDKNRKNQNLALSSEFKFKIFAIFELLGVVNFVINFFYFELDSWRYGELIVIIKKANVPGRSR